ncbi:hypothetical protein LXL04_019908 [Taraxacum kok-saghyz]
MPSGPKKRRASKRKKGGIGNGGEGTSTMTFPWFLLPLYLCVLLLYIHGEMTRPLFFVEENLELHESLSNVLDMSFRDQKADRVVDEFALKFVDIQMGLKENVKENEVVTVVDKSESVGKKEYEYELVDRIVRLESLLNEPSSKNPEENECVEVGDGSGVVMKKAEGMSMERVVEKTTESSSDELVKSVLKVIPLNEAHDSSIPVKFVHETIVDMCVLKEVQDSLGSSSLVDVFPVEDHGSLEMVDHDSEDVSKESILQDFRTGSSSDEPQEMVKTGVQLILNEGAQDPLADQHHSVIEVDVDTISFDDDQETPLGSPYLGYMSPVEGEVPFKGYRIEAVGKVLNQLGSHKEPQGHSLQAKSDEYSSVDNVSPVEGVVHKTGFTQGGESACHIESALKEDGDISMEGVVEEPIELKAVVKSLYEWVLKVMPSIDDVKDQDDSLLEENVETSIKDAQDSSKEPLDDVFPIDQGYECVNVDENKFPDQLAIDVNHVESVMKEDGEILVKDVVEEPHTLMVIKTVDELVLEKEAQEPFIQDKSVIEVNAHAQYYSKESPSLAKVTFTASDVNLNGYEIDPIECSSNETQVNDVVSNDKLAESGTESHIETYAQDSSKGDSSMVDVSRLEGGVQEIESIEVGKSEPLIEFDKGEEDKEDEMMSIDNGVVGEELTLQDQLQEIMKSVNQPVIEVDVDSKDSFKTPLGISCMVGMPPIKGVADGNTCFKVDESASHDSPAMVKQVEPVMKEDEEMTNEGVHEDESNVRSSNEQHILVKKIDQDAKDTCVSTIEPNIETSSKDAQDPSQVDVLIHGEGVVEGNDFIEDGKSAYHGPPPLVNYGDSILKEDGEMSMESALKEHFDDDIQSSIEEKDVHHSFIEPLGSSSLVEDVNNIELVMEENEGTSMKCQDALKKLRGGSPPVDASPNQWKEMVGLAKTLLDEIRRIRAFYEKGLRQTTEIHLHICQVLEKFDSGNLV